MSRDDTASGPEAESEARIASRLAQIQRVMLLSGLGLVLVGSVLEFMRHGHIGKDAVMLADLPARLAAFHGGAILTLGLLVLLVAPASGIAYLIGALFKANDRMHAMLAAIVLGILVFSILFKGAL